MRLLLFTGLVFQIASFPLPAADPPELPPHVLVVLADDLGWGQLACHGHREIETPHLDRFAATGLDFEFFYAFPEGGPSRAALLTGRYPYRTGVSGSNYGEAVIQDFQISIAEMFGAGGWKTGAFGKWMNGANWPHHPRAQGFDAFAGFLGTDPSPLAKLEAPLPPLTASAIVDRAVKFMDSAQAEKRPFFCYLALPRTAGEADSIEAARAEIESMDRHIGRLLEWLEESGLSSRTIVWFLADNGPLIPPWGDEPGRENAFLRGGRTSVHEGGIRVPSLVRWPGRIPEGTNFTRVTTLMDVFPTLMELAEIPRQTLDLPRLDGISLAPILLSGRQPERWPNRVLLNAWTPPGFQTRSASVSVRTDRWVAVRDPHWRRGGVSELHSGWELYDLNADPYQRTDLADAYPFLLSDLRADFSRWMDHTTDDGLGPIPTQIGHAEWPIVTLGRDLVPFDLLPGKDEAPSLSWPIKVVASVPLEVSVEIASAGKSSGTLEVRSGTDASGVRLDFKLPMAKESKAWHHAGKVSLGPEATQLRISGELVSPILGIRLRTNRSETEPPP